MEKQKFIKKTYGKAEILKENVKESYQNARYAQEERNNE